MKSRINNPNDTLNYYITEINKVFINDVDAAKKAFTTNDTTGRNNGKILSNNDMRAILAIYRVKAASSAEIVDGRFVVTIDTEKAGILITKSVISSVVESVYNELISQSYIGKINSLMVSKTFEIESDSECTYFKIKFGK